jgi:peptidyl-prolyl cis-trans isomerase C
VARACRVGAIALLLALVLGSCGGHRDSRPDFNAESIPGCDIVVARVNGEPITAGEVYQKIRIGYPKMAQSGPGLGMQAREMIKMLVTERCFADYAIAAGDDRDPDYLRTLYFARLSLLAQIASRNQITNRVAPSEAWVDSFYQANQENLGIKAQVRWSHIQVDSEAEARRIQAELRAGADFAELARRYSKDPSSAGEGGKMPPHAQGPQIAPFGSYPELDEALFALKAGEVSPPVRTSFGWHILRVEARREAHILTLDEVRPQIVSKIVAQRESVRYQAVVDSLKQAYRVTLDDEGLDRFHRLQMNEDELFAAARKEKDPAREIRFYQEIRERYPQGERAPEALFMIGFVCKEKLNDLPRATETLERFLADYPDHAMAASARTLLDEAKRGVGSSASGG